MLRISAGVSPNRRVSLAIVAPAAWRWRSIPAWRFGFLLHLWHGREKLLSDGLETQPEKSMIGKRALAFACMGLWVFVLLVLATGLLFFMARTDPVSLLIPWAICAVMAFWTVRRISKWRNQEIRIDPSFVIEQAMRLHRSEDAKQAITQAKTDGSEAVCRVSRN